MRGVPAWHQQRSFQHPSSVLALRANPPSPTRGEGRGALHHRHARFRVWPLREKSGSGVPGLAYRNLNTWRSFRAPPVSVATVDRSRAPLHVLSMDNDARMIRLPFTKHWRFARNAGPSDALRPVGTESTGRGHRRPTDPRSGTGSRKGDGRIMRERRGVCTNAGAKFLSPAVMPLIRKADFFGRAGTAVDSIHF